MVEIGMTQVVVMTGKPNGGGHHRGFLGQHCGKVLHPSCVLGEIRKFFRKQNAILLQQSGEANGFLRSLIGVPNCERTGLEANVLPRETGIHCSY